MKEKIFKVIVAGGRDFENFSLLEKKLNIILKNYNKDKIEIVSGMADGADTLALKYAQKYNIAVKEFRAHWKELGKRAGYLRNKQMSEYADACICFWDGKSKGTNHMIELAKESNLNLRVIYYGSIVTVSKGDLFEHSQNQYLVHCISADAGINPKAMGKGIAVQFNKKFEMKKKIEQYNKTSPINIGDAILIDKTFNLITKAVYYGKPTYETLSQCLISLKKICIQKNIELINAPKIGCGLDSLDFNEVLKLLKKIFEDTNIKINIYYIK